MLASLYTSKYINLGCIFGLVTSTDSDAPTQGKFKNEDHLPWHCDFGDHVTGSISLPCGLTQDEVLEWYWQQHIGNTPTKHTGPVDPAITGTYGM